MLGRIGHVTPWGIPCGVAKHLSYWLPELPLARESIIFAETPPGYYPKHEAWGWWPVMRCWQRGQETALQTLTARAEEWHIKVLHFQWDPSFYPHAQLYDFGQWAQSHGVKIVVTLHVILDSQTCEWANKAMIAIADQLVVGTPAMAIALEAYAARFNIRLRRPVKVIPLSCPPITAPKPFAFDSEPTIFAWGLMGQVKGHAQVHQAVVRLRARGHVNARYVIAGLALTGEQQQMCRELRELSANDGQMVDIHEGWHSEEDIYSMCRAAQVIVLNHQWRHPSSSGTVAASVASGTPVVVSQSPMFSGYTETGAVLVASGNGDAMADAIEQALNNPMAHAAAVAEVMHNILPSAVARQYELTYQDLDEA